MYLVPALVGALRAILRTRADLVLENLALRQQLGMLRRRSKRPQLGPLDRAFWVWLSKRWARWRDALHVVRPETVIRWHRQGFRVFSTWKSRRARGRPLSLGGSGLVRTMALANPLWGAPRIPWRVAQAGVQHLSAHRCPPRAASSEAALAELANLPSDPPRRPLLQLPTRFRWSQGNSCSPCL